MLTFQGAVDTANISGGLAFLFERQRDQRPSGAPGITARGTPSRS
jgi:hypothetical protein